MGQGCATRRPLSRLSQSPSVRSESVDRCAAVCVPHSGHVSIPPRSFGSWTSGYEQCGHRGWAEFGTDVGSRCESSNRIMRS